FLRRRGSDHECGGEQATARVMRGRWRRCRHELAGNMPRSMLTGGDVTVLKCDIPSVSVLDRGLIEAAYFQDSYRAPLRHVELSVVAIFHAIFAHHPLWMKLLL